MNGEKGSRGFDSYGGNGDSGLKGERGDTGTIGYSGLKGVRGFDGYPGRKGSKGSPGLQGFLGRKVSLKMFQIEKFLLCVKDLLTKCILFWGGFNHYHIELLGYKGPTGHLHRWPKRSFRTNGTSWFERNGW